VYGDPDDSDLPEPHWHILSKFRKWIAEEIGLWDSSMGVEPDHQREGLNQRLNVEGAKRALEHLDKRVRGWQELVARRRGRRGHHPEGEHPDGTIETVRGLIEWEMTLWADYSQIDQETQYQAWIATEALDLVLKHLDEMETEDGSNGIQD